VGTKPLAIPVGYALYSLHDYKEEEPDYLLDSYVGIPTHFLPMVRGLAPE
jgi:hypothetical protein